MTDAQPLAAGVADAPATGIFRSLNFFNARLYFAGLLLSTIGSWVQLTATSYLVYRLTGRASDLGYNVAFQFLPMLVLGTWAGSFADRFDRRKIMLVTQILLAVQALVLGVLDLTNNISLPVVWGLSLFLGIIGAIDNPARRGLITELVPIAQLSNAMSMNTTVMTGSRIFGAALAAVLIGPLGTGWLFVINGLSYAFMIYGIVGLRQAEMVPAVKRPAGGQPVRDVFRFVRSNRRLSSMFFVYVVVSTFAFNYSVVFPKLADVNWGSEDAFGWLMTVTGVGSIFGALVTARFTRVSLRWLVINVAVLGASNMVMAFVPNLWWAYLLCLPLGFGGAAMIASGNAISQQESPPDMRGRLLALTAVAFLGSTPIGGPITGLIADYVSLEWSMAYGGVMCFFCVGVLAWQWR
ncbi:MAG: MFS transporter [Actinobacteria bacterium]|nr:MFS transporter [Actinomycetota bacterium]NDC46646.1 MFS transporter [Actinomycetota bacterium]